MARTGRHQQAASRPVRAPTFPRERPTQLRQASEREPPDCTLIRVDCLVTADAPNGLICIGQRLGALIPGVMARRELP